MKGYFAYYYILKAPFFTRPEGQEVIDPIVSGNKIAFVQDLDKDVKSTKRYEISLK